METFLIPLHGAFGGPGLFGGLLVALLIAFAATRLLTTGRLGPVRLHNRPGRGPNARDRTPEDDALDTLRSRLAAGDITQEEYLERSSVLRRPPTEN